MKGLLIKDLKLIKMQRNVLLVIIVVASLMILRTENYAFGIGYMTFIGALFTLSTINCDEEDNGTAFLFALPISRKRYVMEKYMFGLLFGGGCWLIGTLLAVASVLTKDVAVLWELPGLAVLVLPILFVLLAVMIPFQLKFGGERGRIAIIAAIGGVCLVGVGVERLARMFHIELLSVLKHLLEMGRGVITALALGVGLMVLYISYRISVSIMNRKEF